MFKDLRISRQRLLTKIKARTAWRLALRGFYALCFVALFANFLANDKPLLCSLKGEWYAPAFKAIGVDLGLTTWPANQLRLRWNKQTYDWDIWPPVPYGPSQQDIYRNSFTSPFDQQEVESNWSRHWLGTDDLGRDVLSGMIWGTRTALVVGLSAVFIATFIGILLGSLAGFFGNQGLQLERHRFWGGIVGLIIGAYWGFIARQPLWSLGEAWTYLFGGIAITLLSAIAMAWLWQKIWRGSKGQQRLNIPLDSILMRSIEIITSIPALLLLLSIVAIIRQSSMLSLILIIGVLSWTGIARFVRGELLRIRELEYLQAAKVLGFSSLRILFRQALPNALGPVYVAIAFSIAGTVVLEAVLSFLGIGLPADLASWGRLMSYARHAPEAWWLAIFPGLAIFITVVIFNLLGEAVGEA